MRKLSVFNFLTLNGYYKGPAEDISWHQHGEEEGDFAAEGAKTESVLLYGRKTYQMMASFWPTAEGKKFNSAVAEGMNNSEKIVFSRTLKTATWQNTKIIKDNIVEEIENLKKTPGKDMTMLGSGSILTQFAEAGLIDVFQFMVDPVALGDGTALFQGLKKSLNLKLTGSKTFKTGVVLLNYEPKK
jgi:dihydrofolate reductase